MANWLLLCPQWLQGLLYCPWTNGLDPGSKLVLDWSRRRLVSPSPLLYFHCRIVHGRTVWMDFFSLMMVPLGSFRQSFNGFTDGDVMRKLNSTTYNSSTRGDSIGIVEGGGGRRVLWKPAVPLYLGAARQSHAHIHKHNRDATEDDVYDCYDDDESDRGAICLRDCWLAVVGKCCQQDEHTGQCGPVARINQWPRGGLHLETAGEGSLIRGYTQGALIRQSFICMSLLIVVLCFRGLSAGCTLHT